MYDRTGMTQDQRDVLIYDLYRRRVTYAKIAKRVGSRSVRYRPA